MNDPTPYKGTRLQLQLGKFPVVGIKRGPIGLDFAIQLPGAKIVVTNVPLNVDIREGDLVTPYVEVPMVPHA